MVVKNQSTSYQSLNGCRHPGWSEGSDAGILFLSKSVVWLCLNSSDLSFSSCSRRSWSSLSLCFRACLRFSAKIRAASSGSLVPAMGLDDGEGAGDAAGPDGAEWTDSGAGAAADVVGGVDDAWGEATAEVTVTGHEAEEIICGVSQSVFTHICLQKLEIENSRSFSLTTVWL